MIKTTNERGIMTSAVPRLRAAARAITPVGPVLALAIVVAPSPAIAQVRMTVPPQAQPIALRGATIHTVTSGVIENGTIVFENGVITAVGDDVTIPSGARVVDLGGKHIYPGLVDAYTTVGISEIGAVDMSNDVREVGDFNPNIRAELGVNNNRDVEWVLGPETTFPGGMDKEKSTYDKVVLHADLPARGADAKAKKIIHKLQVFLKNEW